MNSNLKEDSTGGAQVPERNIPTSNVTSTDVPTQERISNDSLRKEDATDGDSHDRASCITEVDDAAVVEKFGHVGVLSVQARRHPVARRQAARMAERTGPSYTRHENAIIQKWGEVGRQSVEC